MTTLAKKELGNIVETAKNAGLQHTITVTAYDNGMLLVNGGKHANDARPIDITGWAGVSAIVGQHIAELAKRSANRLITFGKKLEPGQELRASRGNTTKLAVVEDGKVLYLLDKGTGEKMEAPKSWHDSMGKGNLKKVYQRA